jgi:hypothetical protein
MENLLMAHSDIRRMVSDFVAEATSLCQRLLFSDRVRLNAMDLHVLRAQLRVLDAEAANLEHLLSASTAEGMTAIEARRIKLKNQEPALKSEAGRAP